MQYKTVDEGRNHTRELWIDDETRVSWLTIIDLPMRIGSVAVRMAGIAGVQTHWEHRMKGYMRHLFEDSLRYMMDEGYDVSVLFGIPNFYPKFGYASCLPSYSFTVKTRDAEVAAECASTYTVRKIEKEDMPAVLALYNQHNATRTGSIVRTLEEFSSFPKGSRWGSRPETMLWEGDEGQVLAYAVWDKYDKAVNVVEVEAQDDALFPTLLAAFAEQAVTKRCEDVSLYLPMDHPFAEFAQRYGTEWKITYPRHAGGMGRIFNQQALFVKLIPELDRRLALVPGSDTLTGTLAFKTDLSTTSLVVHHGRVKDVGCDENVDIILSLSQDKLMQLLMGYRRPRDVLNDEAVTLDGAGWTLLNALFSKEHPFMWLPDHF